MTFGREPSEVVVVTGAGGMGIQIARQLGIARHVVLADHDARILGRAAEALRGEGYVVHEVQVDVSDLSAVSTLASTAASLGRLSVVVHTAGVSPVQASPDRVVAVDVAGTAYLLDAFLEHAETGTVVVCIASMAGAMVSLPPELEQLLATTPSVELASLEVLDPAGLDAGSAYSIAKRANQLRVQAASVAYGRKGARVVSISPGVVSTPMGQAELDGPSGDQIRRLVLASGTQRLGTPTDIAAAVQFLASPQASFITGVDLLVDGGVVAAMRWAARPAGE